MESSPSSSSPACFELDCSSPKMRSKSLEELVAKCQQVLKQNPNNRCCKYAIDYLSSEDVTILSSEGTSKAKIVSIQQLIFLNLSVYCIIYHRSRFKTKLISFSPTYHLKMATHLNIQNLNIQILNFRPPTLLCMYQNWN